MSDLWIGEYERVMDEWVADCRKYDIAAADENAALALRGLGLDQDEIEDHLDALRH